MNFVRKSPGHPTRLGILPGTFNPITVAHVGLARAALSCCEEVLLVLPRVFPHKEYSGASLQERLELINRALADMAGFSIAVAKGGLFVEIATECREVYGPDVRLSFLCGRDAAERIVGWDYGDSVEFLSMLQKFDLLVAGRNGDYTPPAELAWAIQRLELEADFDQVSASEVRDRLARGAPWEHLVPACIHNRVRQIYRQADSTGLG